MLEIYNESVYDLLTATGEDLDLQLKPKSEEVHVKGLSWEEVRTGSLTTQQHSCDNREVGLDLSQLQGHEGSDGWCSV